MKKNQIVLGLLTTAACLSIALTSNAAEQEINDVSAKQQNLSAVKASEVEKVKVIKRFEPLYKDFGRNSKTELKVISGPKEVKMRNGGVPGKQWVIMSGNYRFKVTLQDSTEVKLDELLERLRKLPGIYIKGCVAVSDEGEDGIAVYADLGGASAHGGQEYINIVPHANAIVIAHEIGHTMEQVSRASNPKVLEMWAEAIKSDMISISDYGDGAHHEDLAEFAFIYAVCLDAGKQHLADLKKLSPKRFAQWEKIIKTRVATNRKLY